MARPEPRNLTVMKSVRITPNLHRLTLGGEGLADFPRSQSGGYIKLMLPGAEGRKTPVRTYTIRSQSERAIEVDFALHGSIEKSGPATKWALNARTGDMVKVGGPGAARPLPDMRGPFLLVGDMTALPAISVNLKALSDEAKGDAIILVRDAGDKQRLAKPAGVVVHWLVEADLGANPTLLADAVRKLPTGGEVAYAWVACEFEAMKLLRQFLRVERQFGPDRLYISSYWKRGLMEDDHKQIKRDDLETAD
ncbi:siderophore-interacting protein [uncultured Parasphingorhabdus sp.]|uniref:siderophore-interacting protein n=1 Tax=uncultured Parasphingorhabdus sp. TaxID=2709694 RepID=UPI0030D896F0